MTMPDGSCLVFVVDDDDVSVRESLQLLIKTAGWRPEAVGGELGISEITVKAHRGQMMRKMKAESLADLVTMAARLELRSMTKHSPSRFDCGFACHARGQAGDHVFTEYWKR
jgi:FixJ family two-component response regulator